MKNPLPQTLRSALRKVIQVLVILAISVLVVGNNATAQDSWPDGWPTPTPLPHPDTSISELVSPIPVSTLLPVYAKEREIALSFVVATWGSSLSNLLIESEGTAAMPMTQREFYTFMIYDHSTDLAYSVFVNKNTGEAQDISEVKESERNAIFDKYGNLAPQLYDRLEAARPTEEIPVAFWLKFDVESAFQEFLSQAKDSYPELADALQRRVDPFIVIDESIAKNL